MKLHQAMKDKATAQSKDIDAALAAGDELKALRIAAGYQFLGAHKERITRGYAALKNADFYRQMGKNVDALVADGIAAVKERYAA